MSESTISNIKINGMNYSLNDSSKASIESVLEVGEMVSQNNQLLAQSILKLDDLITKVNENNSSNSTGSSSSQGIADLVAITSYTKGYNNILSFRVSGLTLDEMGSGYDLSDANGVYTVTEETAQNPPEQKVYTFNNASGQRYYIWYIPESTDGMYYSYGWAFGTSIVNDPGMAMMVAPIKLAQSGLAEGTHSWSGEMNMLYMNLTISDMVSTFIPAVAKVKKVKSYNSSNLSYEFEDEELTYTLPANEYYYDLQEHQLYLIDLNSQQMINDRPIACEAGPHLRTYIVGDSNPVTMQMKNNRNTNTDGYYFPAWQYPTFCTSSPERYTSENIDNRNCIYCNYDAERMVFCDRDWFSTGKYGYYPATISRKWSYGALFHKSPKKQRLMVIGADQKASIDIDWTLSSPEVSLKENDQNVFSYNDSDLSNGWHHVLMTYDFDTKSLIMYIDGIKRYSHNIILDSDTNFQSILPYIGYDIGGYSIGYVCEIKFWDITLTESQVLAEYEKLFTEK